jgi:NitT/TauT family transport system substrate-binding protein
MLARAMRPPRSPKVLAFFAAGLSSLMLASCARTEAPKPTFTLAWSVYVGYDPYPYMQRSGILKKWANKYNVDIQLRRLDYAASIDAFVAKTVDACAMTNMEALDMPAAAGVDTTVLFIDDFSNGNDMILARGGARLQDIPGEKVLLIEKTVSQYLLERALALHGMEAKIPRLSLINTTDVDIAAAFLNDPSIGVAVTWKPMAGQIEASGKAQRIFYSSQIPGEIIDVLALRTEVLNRPDGSGDRFAKALTGAWYETMSRMASASEREQVLQVMAEASQDTLVSLKSQLATTQLFFDPAAALTFANSSETKQKMQLVRTFCFRHNLLGDHTQSVDDVAIQYPDKSVQGRPDRVRLRFEQKFMMAASNRQL